MTVASLVLSCSNNKEVKEEKPTKDTNQKSIPSEVRKSIGGADIKIAYHSPAVRGRVIWGGLVPFDAVWVTGAHKATSLEIGKTFQIGDQTILAGKYALFTIPGKEEWTIILNKNWNQHLADDYSEAEDVARLKVKPVQTTEMKERLTYEISETGAKSANITIRWEKLQVPFEIKLL